MSVKTIFRICTDFSAALIYHKFRTFLGGEGGHIHGSVCGLYCVGGKQKYGVIAGASLLWFYHIAYTFSLPVSMPLIMRHYDAMAHFATLSAISALLQCLVTPLGGKLGDQFGRRTAMLQFGSSVGSVLFNAFYTIFYNSRFEAAAALGEAGTAIAVSETFTALALFSAASGALIAAVAIVMVPRRRK